MKKTLNAAFFLLALLTFGMGFFSFQRQIEAIRPLGFFVEEREGVSVVTQIEAGSNAELAGITSHDLILSVNGKTGGWAEQRREILEHPDGVTLKLRRTGGDVEVFYQPPPKNVDIHYLTFFFIGGVFLIIGLITFFQRPYFLTRLFFFLMMAGFALLAVVPSGKVNDLWRTLFGWRLLMEQLIWPAAVNFLLFYPRALVPDRWRRWVPLLYLPGSVLVVLLTDGLLLGGRFGVSEEHLMALYSARTTVQILFFAAGAALFAVQWARPKTPLHQQRWNWVLIGFLGLLPYLLLEVLPQALGTALGIPLWILAIPITLLPLGLSYSLLNFRIGDAAEILRTVGASLLAFFAGLFLYILVNLLMEEIFPREHQASRNFLLFTAGFAIAVLLLLTKNRWDAWVDRLAGGHKFPLQNRLMQFAESMALHTDPDALLRQLAVLLRETLRVQKMNFYSNVGGRWVLRSPDPALPEVLEEKDLRSLDAPWTTFPVLIQNAPLGLLVVGEKEGGMPLAQWEKNLLRTTAGQLSLYFQNLMLMKNLEEKLKELEYHQQFLENIFHFSPIGILVVEEAGGVVSANPKARELLSLAETGINLFTSFPALARGGQENLMLTVQDRTLLATQARIRFTDRDAHYLILLNDISEKLTLQEQLKEREKMAILCQLAATIAHEINTPITGICSYAQMLQPLFPQGSPEARKFGYIQQESFHVSRVVSSLLEFSRSQKRRAVPVPLGGLVRQALDILEPRLSDHAFAVRTAPPDNDPVVMADPVLVPQALMNIILNSCEAVEWKGRVELAWGRGDGAGVLTVTDDGPGIGDDLREKVMEPFVTTKGDSGTGLGLTISRAIIGSLGGSLALESAPGQGTRVRIELLYENAP